MQNGNVHPTAIVEDGARVGSDVRIGPYCLVGGEVALGDGVELLSHVAVAGRTTIGARTRGDANSSETTIRSLEFWSALLTAEQKKKFLPLCPDFVIELRSPSDNLKTVQEKMQEYLDNGAQVGWLIDPLERRVHVYRAGQAVVCLENPLTISGDPELPGFVLDLTRIWENNF